MTDETAPRRGGHRLLALAYLVVFALLVAAAAAVTFLGDPHAGDSVVRLDLPGARVAAVASRRPQAVAQPAGTTALQDAGPPVPVVAPKVTEQLFAGKALVADPSLIENTPDGPLPRIADNGVTPMRAYAPAIATDGRPRIAIVIAGLGISAKATQEAIRTLPPGVTLAFAPYAGDAQNWVAEARKAGHEVLLEVPMEPYDFPDSDPGPHTLRSGGAEDSNTGRLVWALTRFSGYAGVTNLLGGRFLSDPNAVEPMLTYLSRRGLMFYDDGSVSHSAVPDVAGRVGAAFAQADSTIDKIETSFEIDRRLSSLEAVARSRGTASGAGFIHPLTIDRVVHWSESLAGRGFVLVPASAIVAETK